VASKLVERRDVSPSEFENYETQVLVIYETQVLAIYGA
jgi:hypothetical protein